ncbi:unnamed protein product [Caenorhabditis auriculariae]|uniref:Uncharacterized protein n=1 Tax=Caenorhabditis auriculariae TaxID=2777116 RepID=A0A8S1H2H9_9PELO|nr:unnamed protein product [Caenorhabditis auriculariae]
MFLKVFFPCLLVFLHSCTGVEAFGPSPQSCSSHSDCPWFHVCIRYLCQPYITFPDIILPPLLSKHDVDE